MGFKDNGIMVREESDQYFTDDSDTMSYDFDIDMEFYKTIQDMKVTVKNGDVYVNGEFAGQLCWTPQQIGNAIAWYIASHYNTDIDS